MPAAAGAAAAGSRLSAAASACRWAGSSAKRRRRSQRSVSRSASRPCAPCGASASRASGSSGRTTSCGSSRKLGGILIEMRGESAGPAQVVIGIGINVRMPAAVRLMLAEQQAALISDVHEIMRERTPTRNALVAMLAEENVEDAADASANRGFEPFAEEWRQLDTLADAPVRVISGTRNDLRSSPRRRSGRHAARRRRRTPAAIRLGRSQFARSTIRSCLCSSISATPASSGRASSKASSQPQAAAPHAGWSAPTFVETVLHSGGRCDRVLVSNVSGPRMADIVRSAVAQAWQVEPEFVTSSASSGRDSQRLSAAAAARRRSLARHDRRPCARARSPVRGQRRDRADDRRRGCGRPPSGRCDRSRSGSDGVAACCGIRAISRNARSTAGRAMHCSRTTRWARFSKAQSMRSPPWSSAPSASCDTRSRKRRWCS